MTTGEPGGSGDASAAVYGGRYTLPGLNLTRWYMRGVDFPRELTPDVIELLRVCFNGGPNWFWLGVPPGDHLEWKFREFPGTTEVILSLDEQDEVVGFVGGIHRRWLVRGRPLVARDGVDLCRHPAWQGRGVMRALRPFSAQEWHPAVDFSLGWVTHPADRKMSLEAANFAPANPAHDYIRLFRVPRRTGGGTGSGASQTGAVIYAERTNPFRRAGRAVGLGVRALLASTRRRPLRTPQGVEIRTAERFDERVSELAAEASRSFDFIQERTETLLNWRYADRRAGPFVIRLATRGDELLGYAVTRILRDEAHIADILVRPGEEAVAEALVGDALRLAREAGVTDIRCRLPRRHPYAGAIRRAGFLDLGATAGELIGPRDTDPAVFGFLASPEVRVHLVLGDSDTI